MKKATLKATLVAVFALWMLPLLLNATHLLRNDLLKLEAVKLIDTMGRELKDKTGINAYVIATYEHFPQRFNLVEYTKQYEANTTKPYVLFIFAPYATIIEQSDVRGRVGIIPSSKEIKSLYDYEEVRDASVNIVSVKDSNSDEDKFNIAVLQGYSVLADNIASSKGKTLTTTIPDEMGTIVTVLRVIVYTGTLLLFWVFFFRRMWLKMRGKKDE